MDSKNGAGRKFFDPSYFVTALRILKTWMYYCKDLARSCEHLNFSRTVLLNDMLLRKIKQSVKKIRLTTLAYPSLGLVLFAQKNSNFHKFLPDLQNNPDKFINTRRLYNHIILKPNGKMDTLHN